eukprot:805236-Pelagomonas_calceolata.AAC.3
MLDENVSPAVDQPDSRAVGKPPCNPNPTKLARKLHAHSVQYARKLTSTRGAIESTQRESGALGPHAASNPPDPH